MATTISPAIKEHAANLIEQLGLPPTTDPLTAIDVNLRFTAKEDQTKTRFENTNAFVKKLNDNSVGWTKPKALALEYARDKEESLSFTVAGYTDGQHIYRITGAVSAVKTHQNLVFVGDEDGNAQVFDEYGLLYTLRETTGTSRIPHWTRTRCQIFNVCRNIQAIITVDYSNNIQVYSTRKAKERGDMIRAQGFQISSLLLSEDRIASMDVNDNGLICFTTTLSRSIHFCFLEVCPDEMQHFPDTVLMKFVIKDVLRVNDLGSSNNEIIDAMLMPDSTKENARMVISAYNSHSVIEGERGYSHQLFIVDRHGYVQQSILRTFEPFFRVPRFNGQIQHILKDPVIPENVVCIKNLANRLVIRATFYYATFDYDIETGRWMATCHDKLLGPPRTQLQQRFNFSHDVEVDRGCPHLSFTGANHICYPSKLGIRGVYNGIDYGLPGGQTLTKTLHVTFACVTADGRCFGVLHGNRYLTGVVEPILYGFSDRTHASHATPHLKKKIFYLMCVMNRLEKSRNIPLLPMQIWLHIHMFVAHSLWQLRPVYN
jgi:hypothetical protein